MKLLELDDSLLDMVLSWLNDKENARWLDFGGLLPEVSKPLLQVMFLKETNMLRVFTEDYRGEPIGVVVLSNINRHFRSAMLWYVLGNKGFGKQNYTTRAVSELLSHGFGATQLHSIYAWVVETNKSSFRILEKNHFKLVGRQRQCHIVDGVYRDRLLFDLLEDEFILSKLA